MLNWYVGSSCQVPVDSWELRYSYDHPDIKPERYACNVTKNSSVPGTQFLWNTRHIPTKDRGGFLISPFWRYTYFIQALIWWETLSKSIWGIMRVSWICIVLLTSFYLISSPYYHAIISERISLSICNWISFVQQSYILLNSSPLDKMAATLADDNIKCIFLNENDRITIIFALIFLPCLQMTIGQHWFR